MKRLLLALCIFVMSVTLCACGSSLGVGDTGAGPLSSEPNAGADSLSPEPNADSGPLSPEPNAGDGHPGEARSISGDAYSSPENAIHSFIDAVKGGDMDEMAASFAIQNYVDGYDPDSDDAKLIPQPTLEERTMKAYQQIFTFLAGFGISYDESFDTDAFSDMDMESLIDPSQYESMRIVRIDLPETDEETHMERISRDSLTTRLYGADGWDYRTALLSLDGKTYYCGFGFAVYNGNYEITYFSCPFVFLDSNLATIPCTEEDYIQITGM